MDYTDTEEKRTDTETETDPPQTLDHLSDELERRADAAELLAQPGSGGRRSHAYQAGKVAGLREAVSAVRALAQRQADNDDAPDRSDDVELVTDGGRFATAADLLTADADDLVGVRVRVTSFETTREGDIVEVIDPEDTPAAQPDRGLRYQADDGETILCYPDRPQWDVSLLPPAVEGDD
jgi:hypothetical protein